MAPKKTMDTIEWGQSIGSITHSWKKDGGTIIGKLVKVERVIGQEYRGTGEKTQCKATLENGDGGLVSAFMPERWCEPLASWVGSILRIVSSEPGKVTTRYTVTPAKGFKPLAQPAQIETVRQAARDDGKARATKNARRALK